ncbi:hypothetical protein CN982_18330 [Bacillus cereus]|uniref:hypothetical protein n=1 Tax=Bacillus cereus TaxID=1396 RepID=UPI000BFB6ADE|nr:hypothetical protein [Bacillus cereus]PGO26295.1 hypothetical protein CN982_18330 [Bacillus cereus]
MRLQNDCILQFQEITKNIDESFYQTYKEETFMLFSKLYALNYLTNRVEVSSSFESSYYNVTSSCLIESFSLLIENHPRGCLLVIRSGLENFLKHLILAFGDSTHKIHDRQYVVNKNTLDKVIEATIEERLQSFIQTINEQLLSQYKQLSGLSHSLVPQSKDTIVNYFSELKIVKQENIDLAIKNYEKLISYIFDTCVIFTTKSLKQWEYSLLDELLSLTYGNKKKTSMLNLIKDLPLKSKK